jgi:hypothetical protein
MAKHQLARHCFSMEAEEWERFGAAVKATSPELTCSMVLRELVRYWTDLDDVQLRIGPLSEKETA